MFLLKPGSLQQGPTAGRWGGEMYFSDLLTVEDNWH